MINCDIVWFEPKNVVAQEDNFLLYYNDLYKIL